MRLICASGLIPMRIVATTGTLASGSAVVTGISDTSTLAGALGASGPGVPAGSLVASIDSPSQLTLSQPATTSGQASLSLTLEPISLAEAKLQCRVDFPDDDALFAGLITSARVFVENHLRQALLTQAWTLYLDSFPSAGGYYNRAIREVWPSLGGLPSGLGFYPGLIPNSTGVIDIPKPPLQSKPTVQYLDFSGTLQTVDPSTFGASLGFVGRLQPAYSKVWPIGEPVIDSVRIAFSAGYGDTAAAVPDPIKAAIKLCVGHWYRNREWVSAEGAAMARVPETIDALLASVDHGSYH